MAKITTIYHPHPTGAWPEGEPVSVRAAYDLTRELDTHLTAAQQAMALETTGPDLEAEP